MRTSKPLTMLFLGCTLLMGCGVGASKNKGKLEGTSWGSEATSFMGRTVPAGHLRLLFKHDGKMVYHIGNEAYAGKFECGGGELVTFHLDRELAGKKSHLERIWFDGDKLMVSDVLGPKVGFRRLK